MAFSSVRFRCTFCRAAANACDSSRCRGRKGGGQVFFSSVRFRCDFCRSAANACEEWRAGWGMREGEFRHAGGPLAVVAVVLPP